MGAPSFQMMRAVPSCGWSILGLWPAILLVRAHCPLANGSMRFVASFSRFKEAISTPSCLGDSRASQETEKLALSVFERTCPGVSAERRFSWETALHSKVPSAGPPRTAGHAEHFVRVKGASEDKIESPKATSETGYAASAVSPPGGSRRFHRTCLQPSTPSLLSEGLRETSYYHEGGGTQTTRFPRRYGGESSSPGCCRI